MKIENRIEEKDEHWQRLEILNQNSNSALVGVDPWIDEVFSLPWSSPMEKAQNFVQENGKTKVKKRKKNEEQSRKNSLILKLAQQVINFAFVQNEVTN